MRTSTNFGYRRDLIYLYGTYLLCKHLLTDEMVYSIENALDIKDMELLEELFKRARIEDYYRQYQQFRQFA